MKFKALRMAMTAAFLTIAPMALAVAALEDHLSAKMEKGEFYAARSAATASAVG